MCYHAELAAGAGGSLALSLSEAYVSNYAAWAQAIRSDPMAIFTAAKDAEFIVDYLLGTEKSAAASATREEWIADYENADLAMEWGRAR